MQKQTRWKWLVAFLLILFCLIIVFQWRDEIFQWILQLNDPIAFQVWLDGFGWRAALIMVLCVAAKVIVPMLPGKVLEIAAGYCFGFGKALGLVLLGNVLGTTIVRHLVKRFGRPLVLHFVKEEDLEDFPLWKQEQRFTLFVWLTYLIPGTPKDALTYVISLSSLSTIKLVTITTIARIFTVTAGVLSGSALSNQEYQLALAVTIIFFIISSIGLYLYREYVGKRKDK